jgi:uncharacterized membrane protein
METHARSLMKSITFRIVATFITILLVLVFTGSLTTSVAVGSLEFVFKMIVYYLHERIWNMLQVGRKSAHTKPNKTTS